MSEMDVHTVGGEPDDGKFLAEEYGVGGPPAPLEDAQPPVRTAGAVAFEIRTLQSQARGIILSYAIEIGRRLEEAKAMLPHGEWGAWLKRELNYSQSAAQNFMKVYREYGDSQQSLFGGIPKSQAFGNLTFSKALSLLAIPDEEERARFATENDVEHMTTRELNEALKARNEAQEAATAAQEEAEKLRKEKGLLQEQLDDQARVYNAKLTSAGVEVDQAKAEAQAAKEALAKATAKAQKFQDALSDANASAQTAEEEHARLLRELEELRNRPAEADTAAVDAARKAAIEEMTEKVNKAKDAKKQAEDKRKTAEEALAAAQRELDELKTKGPEVRELTQEEKDALTARAVEQARAKDAEQIQNLKKELAMADPDTATFKVLFTTWQETYGQMLETLERIKATDSTKAGKLQGAIRAVVEGMV